MNIQWRKQRCFTCIYLIQICIFLVCFCYDQITSWEEMKEVFLAKLQTKKLCLCLRWKLNKTQAAQKRNIMSSSNTFIRISGPLPEVRKKSALINHWENRRWQKVLVVVTGQYDFEFSIKAAERKRRTENSAHKQEIEIIDNRNVQSFQSYLGNSNN